LANALKLRATLMISMRRRHAMQYFRRRSSGDDASSMRPIFARLQD
jgi:hypothetical protein